MESRFQIIGDNVTWTTLFAEALVRSGYKPAIDHYPLLAVDPVGH